MGNAFVACEVVYCIDSYRIQSAQPSNLHTTTRLENGGTPIFSSLISTVTTPWLPTTPEKEYYTPGTTGVWSLIPSCLRSTRLTT